MQKLYPDISRYYDQRDEWRIEMSTTVAVLLVGMVCLSVTGHYIGACVMGALCGMVAPWV